MKNKAYVRKLLQKVISPKVENIYSEIFIKSINSFAFNLVALKLDIIINKLVDQKAMKLIANIMRFECIVKD